MNTTTFSWITPPPQNLMNRNHRMGFYELSSNDFNSNMRWNHPLPWSPLEFPPACFQWENSLWSTNSSHKWRTACLMALTELMWAYSFAIRCFICAQMFSIGLRSGEFGGCWWHLILNSCLTGIHTFLCIGALSSMTTGSTTSPNDYFQKSLSGPSKIWSW